MTPPLHTWEECRICWEAKGHKFENIADAIEQLFKDRIGFKRTSLSGLSRSTKPAPPEAIEFVWGLPLAPGASERKYAIYLRGLELQHKVDVIAAGVGPKMDELQSAIGGRLDALLSAMGDKVEAAASTVRATLDGFANMAGSAFAHANGKLDRSDAKIEAVARQFDKAGPELQAIGVEVDSVGGRLKETGANIDAVGVKVDGVGAKLDDASARVDAIRAQVDGVGVKIDHAGSVLHALKAKLDHAEARRTRDKRDVIWTVLGTGGFVGVGLVSLCVMQWGQLGAPQPRNEAGPHAAIWQAEQSVGKEPHGVILPSAESSMGQGKTGRPMPRTRLRWNGLDQAIAPCAGAATELYRLCWIETAHSPPCPSDAFQEGNKCYVPVYEPPKEPASETQAPPNPERR